MMRDEPQHIKESIRKSENEPWYVQSLIFTLVQGGIFINVIIQNCGYLTQCLYSTGRQVWPNDHEKRLRNTAPSENMTSQKQSSNKEKKTKKF